MMLFGSGFSGTALFLAAVSTLVTPALSAEERVFRYHSKQGVLSFSDIEPIDSYYEEVNFGCYACGVYSEIDWLETTLYPDTYASEIEFAADLYKVDASLVRAIIHAESHFRANAISKQGGAGINAINAGHGKRAGGSRPFYPKTKHSRRS